MPYEARIDRVSFEYFLIRTMPQKLFLINGSSKKFKNLSHFVASNKLQTKVEHLAHMKFSFKTETAQK